MFTRRECAGGFLPEIAHRSTMPPAGLLRLEMVRKRFIESALNGHFGVACGGVSGRTTRANRLHTFMADD